MNWQKNLSEKIRLNESLAKHTTFRIGGKAKFFYQPKEIKDLRQLVINAKNERLKLFIIGAGSNLLISDKGVNGVVVKLNTSDFKNIDYSRGRLEVGAGLSLSRLVKFATALHLTGGEFLAGIPGTVGGALVMNAGISEKIKNQNSKLKTIADLVKEVTVMDYNGKIKILKKREIRFAYRASSLYNYIVLKACLKLAPGNRKEIGRNLSRYLLRRKKEQDYAYPSAGCIFKNPAGLSAGRLIDLCGLKGKRFGDARISDKHANFIINQGKAKAAEVRRLMRYVQNAVRKKSAVNLEPEIKLW